MTLANGTKLGREVAIKVLPEAFASSSERLTRFEREAHVLVSLNHPHLATLHGFEESGGVYFLVMELIIGRNASIPPEYGTSVFFRAPKMRGTGTRHTWVSTGRFS